MQTGGNKLSLLTVFGNVASLVKSLTAVLAQHGDQNQSTLKTNQT